MLVDLVTRVISKKYMSENKNKMNVDNDGSKYRENCSK